MTPVPGGMTPAPVVVVGAGVVGASVAYHLSRAGTPVTLIDRAPFPAAGATGRSFGWIGDLSGDWPGGAEDLRTSVLADHRRLAGEIPGYRVRWTGALDLTGRSAGRWIRRREIEELEPHLRLVPDRAVYWPTDGGVDPAGVTTAMVDAARRLGARVVLGSAVTSLPMASGATVVLATGADVTALGGTTLPVAPSPALLIRMAAPAGLVATIVVTSDFEARELRPGHVILTAPVPDRAIVDHTVDRFRATFRNTGSVRLLDWAIGRRPMPADGPVVGFLPPDRSTYVAVGHSGVTLAPTLGRLIAGELATGKPAPELRRCRPGPRTDG
jgi:glycine/D-amino acid oxidase-like deaminating enzyme